MRARKNKTRERGPAAAKRKKGTPPVYETMSQQQNRSGKGRQQPGSDGDTAEGERDSH